MLAVIALRFRWTYAPITWVTGVLYTIPSLALFVLLVPWTGFTTLTGEIGLVSYTLLILIRNIVAGVDGVPASVKEAADAMGYRPVRRFFAVDLATGDAGDHRRTAHRDRDDDRARHGDRAHRSRRLRRRSSTTG